jgi:phosphoribosylformimino-5-aminoimidazole carboxamide ribotide isomerase
MNITIAGGIDGPHELWHCNTLQQYGVDSVIVVRALAENRFPCQFIWRHVETQSLKK